MGEYYYFVPVEGPFRTAASARSRHWLTVNATPKPPHLGVGRAYLEDVTAAEFCEEGGHDACEAIKGTPESHTSVNPITYPG